MTKHVASSGPGIIEQLAHWVLSLRAEDIADAVIKQAKLLILDTIGCGYAALEEESARAVLATLDDVGGAPVCSVIGRAGKTSAPNAVLVNGALIRILDLNDYVNNRRGEIGGHPSDNIPVALAAAEMSGASGRELIAAIVLGYELFGRAKDLIERDSGWDGVSISGLVAPAMAGRLMGLDAGTLAQALALSGARAATPLAVRHGAISAAKSFANALVAQNGMQATLLARHGVTGPLDLIENPLGLRPVLSNTAALPALTAAMPNETYIMRANIKAYPCLATGQAIVAAGLALHAQVKAKLGGDVSRLKAIRVAMADMPFLRRQKDDPGRINPTSREAADHSFNFLAAVSLNDGEFGLAQFHNERWNDKAVRAIMGRLEIAVDAELNARAPGSFPCRMQAICDDGSVMVADIPDPPGFSRHGLDADAVLAKFNRVTATHLDAALRDRIISAVMELDRSASCGEISGALTGASVARR
ncbi:MAG TPA: MmgE/PrpD family protein [Xanthobacteraceae bacterium]|nr:MmgE/PrpD family protein [Xanthobacteraceae bacterium]